MTPSIPIFRNEINVLGDFRGGVKVARDFAPVAVTVLLALVPAWVHGRNKGLGHGLIRADQQHLGDAIALAACLLLNGAIKTLDFFHKLGGTRERNAKVSKTRGSPERFAIRWAT